MPADVSASPDSLASPATSPSSRGGRAAPVIVVAPDSFKGSLTAADAAAAMAAGIVRAIPDAQVRLCPMADGGEGTLDALLAHGGRRRLLRVRSAAGEMRDAAVGLFDDGSALIEAAEIVGITDRDGMAQHVEHRATQGMGDAVRMLLDEGVRHFMVALGGSSTNDAGAGLLVGLGLALYDEAGQAVAPTPAGLARVARIDASGLEPRLADASFVILSDVDNPLCGDDGATAVFGPQKGVTPERVRVVDAVLERFAGQLEPALARTARTSPGAGAAGGLGFAFLLLGGEFRTGAEVVATRGKLDEALAGAHWLITGEGRSDAQTLHGKAPFIACQHAKRAGVPATLLSGAVDGAALARLNAHFSGCVSPACGPMTLDAALADAARLLTDGAEQMARIWQAARAV